MKKVLLLIIVTANAFVYSQNSRQENQLDSIFTFMYNQNQFNGTVLISDKGKIIYNKGFGFSNEVRKTKNNSTTIYELASCSKQFTAAAIVLLKRAGKLDYKDKISDYLPELEFWNNVTILDLIKHTSGIPEYLIDLPNNIDDNTIATNQDLINYYAIKKDSLQFLPGQKHRYTNTNYALLATIIERVSGIEYSKFLKKNIFKPLNMKNTFVYNQRQSPKKIKNHAIGYVWAKNTFDKVIYEDPSYDDKMVYKLDGIVGNAKVNSTVEDLYKWINTLKNNTFFSPEEFDLMTSVTKTTEAKNINYGFGLDLSKGENKFSFGHTGSWDGYSTFVYHNMIKDRTIIVLQNFKMGAYPYVNINEILDYKPLSIEYKRKINLPEVEIKKYIGTYIDEKNEQQFITYLDGYLVHNSSRVAWDMRFFPVDENEFQAVRQGGTDGVLKFIKQEDGKMKLEMLQYGSLMGSGIRK